jgi:hypothetical protein
LEEREEEPSHGAAPTLFFVDIPGEQIIDGAGASILLPALLEAASWIHHGFFARLFDHRHVVFEGESLDDGCVLWVSLWWPLSTAYPWDIGR